VRQVDVTQITMQLGYQCCDSLIESLHHDDDVTVMLARIPG